MKTKLLFFYWFISLSIWAQIPTTYLNKEYVFTANSLQNTAASGGGLAATGTARTAISDFLSQPNDAISLNGDTFNAGHRGGSVTTDGGEATISFWIKTNTVNSTPQNIVQQHALISPSHGSSGWIVELVDGKIRLTSNFYRAGSVNSVSTVKVFESNVIADNAWHNVIIVLKKEAVYYNARWTHGVHRYIYIDDELHANGVDGGGPSELFTQVSPSNSSVLIANGANKYQGIIDNIRVYNTALEASNRRSLYAEFYRQIPVIRVAKNATGNLTAGTWANAVTSLAKAIKVASAQQEIWVQAGVYTPHSTNRETSFAVNASGVKIYGGFEGNEATLNDRNIELIHTTNKTILSGDLQENDNANVNFSNATRTDNSYRVLDVTGDNVVVDGLTISGAYANATTGEGRFGAGVSTAGNINNFTVKNTIIKENVAWWAAGLVFRSAASTANISIENCVFSNNLTSLGASAFYAYPEASKTLNFSLVNSLIANNSTTDDATRKAVGSAGGWLRVSSAGATMNTTIVNNTFVNNSNIGTATSDFPTLAMSRNQGSFGTVTFANNIFWNNIANNGETALAIGKVADPSLGNNIAIFNSIDEDDFSNIAVKTNVSNTNPLFTDAANNDFSLTNNSPAIDSGENTKLPANLLVDLLGNTRIVNTTIDMGAYEYDVSLSTDEVSFIKGLSVYPNPVANKLFISGVEAIHKIEVYTLNGTKVLETKNKNTTNVSALAAGMYLLKLETSSGKVGIRKFIKK